MLTGTGDSRMLKFASAPDYEDPMGGANDDSNTYDVTLKVTDSSESDVYGTFAVSVTVTNVDELGSLSGPASASVDEGDTDLGTYELTAIEDGPAVTWSLDGTDMSDFMLDGTGMSRMLKFGSAPDYESPMGGADNDSNEYMVIVMASAGGEEETVAVAITVDNVDELGTLSGETRASVMENGTDVGTYMVEGTMADMAMWTLEGDDASHFMLDGTGMSRMLKFSSAPDYEMPRSAAMSATNTNTYMVTVKAEAGGEMDMVAVAITVTNEKEAGTVTLDPARPSVGTEITATLADPDIVEGTVMWQWASADPMDGTFENITGADSDTYTPVEGDAGMYLQATATYDDGYDTGNVEMKVSDSAVSQLAVNGLAEVEHPENVTNVGTYAASGADSVQWTVSGDDARNFNISSGGQLTFGTSPDYEDPADADMDNVYMVTVVATAGTETDSQEVTVTVTDVDEDGMVTVMPTSAMVGTEITATLVDEDSGVTGTTWQWASADAMDGTYTDIDDATSDSYTVADGDAGMYLQATATYDDVHATGQMATSDAVMISVDMVSGYDTNGTEGIQIDELFEAIDDYFDGDISISQLFAVIDAYFG